MSNGSAAMNAAMFAIANARANAEAARADEAEEELSGVINTEIKSMGNVISKRDLFRQAAEEMIRDIAHKTSSGLTSDLNDIRVRAHWYSIFRSAVPADMRFVVSLEAQKLVGGDIKNTLVGAMENMADVASEGLRVFNRENEEYIAYFDAGRGAEFIAGLDENEVRAIAKNGIANILQERLSDLLSHDECSPHDVMGDKLKNTTGQKYRALEAAFVHASTNAYNICETLRAPHEKIVKANLPPAPSPDA